jgi:heat-inducible transcriptional repressor
MLSKRQLLVLIAIVEEYVKTNEPVGSRALSRRPELQYSSATLRNDMADLEELGYLEKTHVSSGRIPSEKGYHLYVEYILNNKNKYDEYEYPMIDDIFNQRHISKEQAINQTMQLVSELTNYTAVVLGNSASNAKIKKLQFVALNPPFAIILMVTNQGYVESKRIIVPDGVSIKEIQQVVNVLDELLHNQYINDIPHILNSIDIDSDIRDFISYHEDLVDVFVNAFSQMAKDKFLITGQSRILNQPEFQEISKARDLLQALESKEFLRVIDSRNDGITVKIGNDNELSAMKDCTVITVPYYSSNGERGTISIFGPTRMEYSKIIPLIEYIADNMKKVV